MGYGREPEINKGPELARLSIKQPRRLLGPRPWYYDPQGKVILLPPPPPPQGYYSPEMVEGVHASTQQEEGIEGTFAELRQDDRRHNVADITPFLGPIRAILLLYGGRRRSGDVAHFAELAMPVMNTKAVQLVVCVVDIVHGPEHDISRGGTHFWEPQLKAGRVAAIGAAPPCETWSIARFANCDGIDQNGWHNREKPVPFRTAWHLWGRKDFTPREARQVGWPTFCCSTPSFSPHFPLSTAQRCALNIRT